MHILGNCSTGLFSFSCINKCKCCLGLCTSCGIIRRARREVMKHCWKVQCISSACWPIWNQRCTIKVFHFLYISRNLRWKTWLKYTRLAGVTKRYSCITIDDLWPVYLSTYLLKKRWELKIFHGFICHSAKICEKNFTTLVGILQRSVQKKVTAWA